MFDPDRLPELKSRVRDATRGDSGLLDEVIRDVALLKHSVTTIQPRNTNSISLVASDGGNNGLEFLGSDGWRSGTRHGSQWILATDPGART